jgi:chitodextrinase
MWGAAPRTARVLILLIVSAATVFGCVQGGARAATAPNWAANASSDFDGDHVSDLGGIYRGRSPQDGLWYAPGTAGSGPFQIYFGATTDIPVAGDYDGDGRTDAAIFRPSTGLWYGPRTGGSTIVIQQVVGQSGDVPIPGDYNGDGKTDPAIYRPSLGLFFALLSGGGTLSDRFGAPGDIPVPRDYNGDGKTDFAIYRKNASGTTSLWQAKLTGGGTYQAFNGGPNDIPVPADYNGDLRADPVVFRPSNGRWSGPYNGASGNYSNTLGQTGDVPVPGYYDGDQRSDPGIFRPSAALWFTVLSGGGTKRFDALGTTTDVAVQARPVLRPPTDTQAPTTPTGLTNNGATANSIDVSWNAASDNTAVAAYGVYVNGAWVASTTSTSFTVGNLGCGTSVSIAVDATDAAANRSGKTQVSSSSAACPPGTGTAPPFRFMINSDQGTQAAAQYGYNLLDVGSASEADALPSGTRGLIWVGDYNNTSCSWEQSDASVRSTVTAAIGDPKVFGFFFSDEPDPFACPNAYNDHQTRSNLIHSIDSGRKTVMLIDSNSAQQTLDQIPKWAGAADYFALDPYPCYQGQTCNYGWIDQVIAAANSAGISYWGTVQAFQDSTWRWPTVDELNHMLGQWAASRESGMMTFAWTWSGNTLSSKPDLLSALKTFNSGGSPSLPPPPSDTAAPSTPTNFQVTGAASSSISVSWTASTDNVGVTGYGLYKAGVLTGSATGTSTTFNGLPCNTSQTLAVDAIDAAGNRSGKATLTASTSACPSDTTAPSTPTGLAQTGSSQTSVSLSWNASTDNVGVSGYNVYRGSALDGTSTTTTYTSGSLTCGTAYSFAVQAKDTAGNVSGQSTALSASTAACGGGGTDPIITAAGDICGSSTDCTPTATLVQQINPTRALTLGDNAYDDGSLAQYNSEYNPNWGAFKAKTSPSPGNHDYHVSGAPDYFTYFGSVAPGPYYSYDLGTWHLISLASSAGVSPGAGGAEETWLKQDLAAHTNKCVLAYWHEPRWSSGTVHGSDSDWDAVWNDLYAAHADVVLNGHEHNYERFGKQNPSGIADANGIREIIAGTGGASHGYPFGTPVANSQVRNDSTWGLIKLTLHPTGYDWQFVPIAGSTFTDSGSDTCS